MLPNLQGLILTPPSPPQVMVVDKGLVTPLLESSKGTITRGGTKKMVIDEVSKEGQMVEYSQPSSQDAEV